MAKIFIDPGHGGKDPGAVGSKSKEKDNVLKVAKKLKTLLEGYGHSVKLSRSTDKFLTLSERAQLANSWGADYFLSLHNNAAVNRNASGFETFIYNKTSNPNTIKLQNVVHDAIASKIGIRDRGKKHANFAVVRETKMPAVLIEYAFISNNEDEKILIEKVNQLAEWTCDGIIDAVGGTIKAKTTKTSSKAKKTVSKAKTSVKSTSISKLTVDGKWGKDTTRALQRYFGTPVDGIISGQLLNSVTKSLYSGTVSFGSGGSMVIRALQKYLNSKGYKLIVDGLLGPATIRALQSYLGTVVDGKLSRPSLVVREMQRRLNNGTF